MKKILSIVATASVLIGGGTTAAIAAQEAEYYNPVFEERVQEIKEEYKDERAQNFECSTENSVFNSDDEKITLSWDAPEGYEDVSYNVQYRAVKGYEWIDYGHINTTDTEFVYDFSDLPPLENGENYQFFAYVDTLHGERFVPASSSAYVLKEQKIVPLLTIEECDA